MSDLLPFIAGAQKALLAAWPAAAVLRPGPRALAEPPPGRPRLSGPRSASSPSGSASSTSTSLHLRAARALAREGEQPLDGLRRTLRVELDGAVGPVAHPARDPERGRPVGGRLPEEHALHAPAHHRAARHRGGPVPAHG